MAKLTKVKQKMAEDVQILEPLKSVVTMSSILSIIEKNETENRYVLLKTSFGIFYF